MKIFSCFDENGSIFFESTLSSITVIVGVWKNAPGAVSTNYNRMKSVALQDLVVTVCHKKSSRTGNEIPLDFLL